MCHAVKPIQYHTVLTALLLRFFLTNYFYKSQANNHTNRPPCDLVDLLICHLTVELTLVTWSKRQISTLVDTNDRICDVYIFTRLQLVIEFGLKPYNQYNHGLYDDSSGWGLKWLIAIVYWSVVPDGIQTIATNCNNGLCQGVKPITSTVFCLPWWLLLVKADLRESMGFRGRSYYGDMESYLWLFCSPELTFVLWCGRWLVDHGGS